MYSETYKNYHQTIAAAANNRSSIAIEGYCFQLGSELIPPPRIRCTSFGFVIHYEVLKVGLHFDGHMIASIGTLNLNPTNYVAAISKYADYGNN